MAKSSKVERVEPCEASDAPAGTSDGRLGRGDLV